MVARPLTVGGLVLLLGGIIWGFIPVHSDGPCGSLFRAEGEQSKQEPGLTPGSVTITSVDPSPTCDSERNRDRDPVFFLIVTGTAAVASGISAGRSRNSGESRSA